MFFAGVTINPVCAQGVFESNTSSGNWQNSGSWTLVSGSDANGVPDANDDVTILSGHRINIRNNEACDDLTIVGRLHFATNNRTLTVNGNLTMSGGVAEVTGNGATKMLSVSGDFNVASGADVDIVGQKVTITGTTTLNGSLNFSSGTGDKTFGNIVINGSGTWNNTGSEDFVFTGNLTNNGTFNGCSANGCDYEFTSSSGSISGSNAITISDIVINSPADITSSATVVVTDELRGSGSFTNENGASLELQGSGPFSVSTFDASPAVNTVTYSAGSSNEILSGDYYNLIINKSSGTPYNGGTVDIANDFTLQSGNFDINATMNVDGAITIGTGTKLELNAATLTVLEDISIEGGEFTPVNASSVANISGDILMSDGIYDQNNGDINVTGDFLITGGLMTFNGTSSTLDVDDMTITTGDVTLTQGTVNVNNGSGGLTVNSGSLTLSGATLSVDNLYNLDGGTNDFNSGSFSAGDIDIATGQELTVNSLDFTSTGTTTISGTLTFDSNSGGKSFNDIVVASGGAWNNTTTASFTINGDIAHNGASWVGCSGSSCDYTLTNSSGSISGSGAIDMSDIIINSPGSYTNLANLTVIDRITGTGTFINGSSGSLNYSGNNSDGSNFDITNFTASATGNTVTFSRAGDQQLRTTTDGNNNYYNVVINTSLAGQDLFLAGNVTIDNQLTLTMGDLILDANTLTLAVGASVSGGGDDNYIQVNSSGTVRQKYSATGVSVSIPIGDNNDFSPITNFTLSGGSVAGGAYIDFSVTDGIHPQMNAPNKASGGDDADTVATAYISRYWTVSGNNISEPTFSASYQYLETDVVGTESDMVAALRRTKEGTMGPVLDWKNAGTVNPSTNIVSIDSGDGFGDMYAMDDEQTRLPIVLLSFTAEVKASKVQLQWSTASELDNDYFTIERSSNGIDFEPILYVPGKGTSEEINNYVAVDDSPISERTYYRLKQTDFNGTFDYSEVISVSYKRKQLVTPSFLIYPNSVLAGQTINVRPEGEFMDETAIIQLLSIAGHRVIEYKIQLSKQTSFEIPQDVQAGHYVLSVTGSSFKKSFKIIVK
ncbi:beta strand repeat-containing protein [Roseivirga echinicomitans]|uniref:Secretion system C-terminal sorting domain-containing protein n=1 Tax=Roseivirga echinicomitans TaxID=296218 RepID=A0A150X2R6_9BACT|nr:T9SS type A sorting domain-containing protein [Roseivirga echinicomitans]KYG73011.1 hypothetical protein AWN68_09965 [Roseivirga echinicomitans]